MLLLLGIQSLFPGYILLAVLKLTIQLQGNTSECAKPTFWSWFVAARKTRDGADKKVSKSDLGHNVLKTSAINLSFLADVASLCGPSQPATWTSSATCLRHERPRRGVWSETLDATCKFITKCSSVLGNLFKNKRRLSADTAGRDGTGSPTETACFTRR